jgi:hypothetical protein
MSRAGLKTWLGDRLAQILSFRGQRIARRLTSIICLVVRHA